MTGLQILGAFMIAVPFIGFYVFIKREAGWLVASLLYLAFGLLCGGCYLLAGGS